MKPSLFKPAVFLMGGSLWTAVCGFTATTLLSRRLPVEDFGVFQWLLWIQLAGSTLSLLGMPFALQGETARLRAQGLPGSAALARRTLRIACGAWAALTPLAWLAARAGLMPLPAACPPEGVLWALLPILPLAFRQVFQFKALAAERTLDIARAALVAAPLYPAVLLVMPRCGIGGPFMAMGTSLAVEALILFRLAPREERAEEAAPAETLLAFRKASFLIGATGALDLFSWQRVEVWMLGNWGTTADTAQYGLAATLSAQIVTLLAQPLSLLLLTRLSVADAGSDTAGASLQLERGLRGMAMAAFPVAAGLAFLSPPAGRLVFGAAYAPAFELLGWLAWGGVNTALLALVSSLFYSHRLASFLLAASATQALLKLVMGHLLIPVYGARGAAGLNAACHILAMLAYAVGAWRLCRVRFPWVFWAKSAAVAILPAVLLSRWVRDAGIALQLLACAVYPLGYIAVLRITGLARSLR